MANILIAEDEDALRHLVSRALRLDGHEVSAAEDGEDALERLQEADGRFDLVLSDIRMPGLTGIELAHAIAVRWPHVKVLLMTGYAEQKEAAEDLASIGTMGFRGEAIPTSPSRSATSGARSARSSRPPPRKPADARPAHKMSLD